jgi:O-antigen/teichoic acid export membrane protein
MGLLSRTREYLGKDRVFVMASGMLFTTTLLASAINYVYHFMMGRMLGPAEYGIIGALFSVIYFIGATLNTVQTVAAKFVSVLKAKSEDSKIGWLLRRISAKMLLLGVGISLALIFGATFIADFLAMPAKHVVTFSTAFILIFVLFGLRGFLQGLQKFRSLSISIIIESVFRLAVALGLVALGYGVFGALVSYGIAVAFSVAFSFVPLAKLRRSAEKYEINSAEVYGYSIPVLIAMLTITAAYTLDVFLAKHFFDPITAGHYAAAGLLSKIIFFGAVSIAQVMFPKISELHAAKQNYDGIFKKALVAVIGVSALATAAYYLFPNFLVSTFFGQAYADITPIVGMFSLAIGILSVNFVFVSYFLSINKTGFMPLLLIAVAAELAGIWFWHSSMQQIITIIAAAMLALLLGLTAYFFIVKSKNENFSNSAGL